MAAIALISPHYFPETNAAGKRLSATADYLQQQGWTVTVVTLLPHHPQNQIYDGFDVTTPYRQEEKGIRVIRLRPWLVPRDNLPLRLLSELLFGWQAFWHLLSHSYDVVLGSSPYMFLGPLGLLASRLKRTTFVWEVRDLTWLYPGAAGKKTYGLDKLLEKLMLFTAHKADGLVTVTEGLNSYFPRHPAHSVIVPNGIAEGLLKQLSTVARTPTFQGERVKVLYAGLLGYNHHLSILIKAAKRLPHIDFTLAGDGPERDALEAQAARCGLDNVTFLGHLDTQTLLSVYARHDLLVSHVRRAPLHRWAQPAKLWEYMATGRAVVHAGEGEATEILERHDIGVTVPPEDPEALAQAIQSLAADPEQAGRLSHRARRFVQERRCRTTLLKNLDTLLHAVRDT